MTKFRLSPYELTFSHSGQKRKGFLLKIQNQNFEEGYSDIFPWPEFGDPEYGEIPKILKQFQTNFKNSITENHLYHYPSSGKKGNQRVCLKNPEGLPKLLKRSIENAVLDGLARTQKKSLLENIKRRNHYFMTHLTVDELKKAQDQNFKRFKAKVGFDTEFEIIKLDCLQKLLNKTDLFRLDCNGRGSDHFFTRLELAKENIEYIEDPFKNPGKWLSSWPFAYDHPGFSFEKVQTSWQVIKPNKQSFEDIKGEKPVYTSSLGHPVGLAHGILFAGQQGPQCHDDGFMSYKLYQKNSFSLFIQEEGPWLSFKPGPGIGFDSALKEQKWSGL